MKVNEMHDAVNLLLDKINSMQADLILPGEIDQALNMAQLAFIKQRFQKGNKFGAGFEESQKRIDDLSALVRDITISIDRDPANQLFAGNMPQNESQVVLTGDDEIWREVYQVSYDENGAQALFTERYMFLISLRAHVNYLDCKTPLEEGIDYTMESGFRSVFLGGTTLRHKVVLCKFVQNDDVFELVKDPFNTTSVDGPFYTFGGISHPSGANPEPDENEIGQTRLEVYTDDTFFTDRLFVRYIKRPREIDNNATNPQNCELSEHVHIEIVNMAVDILLEGISDPRYKSHQAETMKSD